MSNDIQIEPVQRQAIALDGIHGTFRIENCTFEIHYFSTYATPNPSVDEEHYLSLLKELRPMRERVAAKDLSDLNALLQRDLNDERIARELVPYLCGKVSQVGFFPPVLAVLVPGGFIHKDAGCRSVQYPVAPPAADGGKIVSYGSLWSLRYHGVSRRLARLSIYPGTEIIVLDGQHRANAFRYVSNVLKPDVLHAVFYENAPKPAAFASDLPVTIAWFASRGSQKVQPNDISRELFVAVNNTAKAVSQSRTILLDDSDPISLAVNTYFGKLAERQGFRSGGMNLLCACFDVEIDETMSSPRPVFALTNPIALKSATTYAFFGLDQYDKLDRFKANRKAQTNKSRFERLFGHVSYIDTGVARRIQPILDVPNRINFRKRVERCYVPLLDALFQDSALAICHHQATEKTEVWLNSGACGPTTVDTWEKVFCGGEGLFGQMQQSESSKATTYRQAIKEIQDRFRTLRRETVKAAFRKDAKATDEHIDKAYELFDTVACQTGIVMALSVLAKELHRKRVPTPARSIRTCEKLTKLSIEQWVNFLTAFESLYLSDLEANSWPRFQKLFVRLFCDELDTFVKHPQWSPDYEMVVWRASGIIDGFAKSGKPIKEEYVSDALETAFKEVDTVFRKAGEKLLKKPTLEKLARKAISELVRELEKERKEAASELRAAPAVEAGDDDNDDQI